jgi:hypothetical protein
VGRSFPRLISLVWAGSALGTSRPKFAATSSHLTAARPRSFKSIRLALLSSQSLVVKARSLCLYTATTSRIYLWPLLSQLSCILSPVDRRLWIHCAPSNVHCAHALLCAASRPCTASLFRPDQPINAARSFDSTTPTSRTGLYTPSIAFLGCRASYSLVHHAALWLTFAVHQSILNCLSPVHIRRNSSEVSGTRITSIPSSTRRALTGIQDPLTLESLILDRILIANTLIKQRHCSSIAAIHRDFRRLQLFPEVHVLAMLQKSPIAGLL